MSREHPETLIELLRSRAEHARAQRAFVFIHDDGREQTLENGELLERARAVAATLQGEQGQGSRALLLYPPGLEFVVGLFGCLLAGVVAVPAYPPDPARLERTLGRLRAIASDADVSSVLTTATVHALARALGAQAPELASRRWVATDAIEIGAGEGWCEPHVAPDDVALLQYTSGSTAEPRGVMVSHRNALHNSAAIHRLAQHDERSVYVCWLPSYHDMGLIGGILQPIYGGLLGVLMSPASFLQSPVRWLRALSRFGGTTTPFPNFALDHCVRRISAAERDEVDLSALRVACNGAEPVRWETLQRFARTFSPRGFHPEAHYPAYGLAEATLLVSGRSPSDSLRALRVDRAALAAGRVEGGEVLTLNGTDEASTGAAKWAALVSCGRSLPDQELLIVEPEARCPVGPDCVGEIWVRGPSIAQGYFRRPAETAETFGARLADGSGPFLRTGDLGFLRDGELYVTGRRKDLIILRGRNMYPQDIERTAERCHRQLRPGGVAAFAIEGEGEERLALAAEVDARSGPPDWDGIWVALQEAVAREHDVALSVATLLSSGTLPKTSSGKVQRRACREALVRGELTVLRRFSVSVPAAVTPTSESAIAHTGADCTSLYDALHARVARLDRRSTRYRYDLERDIPWHRLDEAGLYAGPSLLASERIDLSSVANTQAADLLQWTLAVNICDRFIALEEAVLRFTAEERAALGGTRSIELLDAEEEKHIAMFRRYGEHLRRLHPELAPDADRYLAAARERLAETFRRLTTPLERHYANWVLIVFFEEYSLFMYRELLRDAPALQPVWLAIHRAHAREEAQHVQTDAAYLAALRVSEEQRYAWSRGIFDALAADFSVLFALLGEHALGLCERLHPEFNARQFVQSGASATLQVLLADKAFSETRAAAPYLAYVAARPQRAEVPLVSSQAAAGIRSWLIDWLAGELSVSPSEVDVRRSFQSYGLDSVRLIALTGDLASFSARRIAATAAYDYPNVELLAEHAIAAPGLLAVPPLSRPGPLPLGARQLRLVALERAHPGEIIDHLTEVFTLEPVSEATVRSVLERLVERHEALRCHIIEGTAGPAQFAERVLEPFPLHVRDVPTDSGSFDEEVRRVALAQDRAPFELNGPLVRAALVRGAAGDRALVLTLHHLVGDGWSMALLRRDFTSLMKSALGQSADPLPTLGRQQADVAARERAFLQSTEASASLAFWSARLGDHPRLRATLPGTTFHGAVERRSLPKETMERLARVAHRLGVTPYIALLTAFCRVLGRESGEDDVLVNTHLFNRSDEDERSLCGYLVNVLTVRTALTSAMPFSEAARSVHVAWMEALEHALPIDEVVRTLRPEAYAERYMPSASAFNMLPALPEGAASGSGPVAPRPDLAPPPGFMFFERMLLVAPDPSGNQWLTLWFNEATVDPPAAAKFLEVLVLDLDAISADNPPASTRVSVCDRRDVVRGAARRFVSERLGVEAWAVSDDVALTRLGLDSVLAAELAGALEDALGSPVDASVVFRHRSIDGIARALSVEIVPAKRVPSAEPGVLSCTELGLFQLFTRDPGPQDPYNLLLTLRIDAPPDAVRLRQALSLLGARHEALRTGFYVGNDGVPRRRVLESVEPPFAVVRVSPAELATARRAQGDALRRVRFELARPPLFSCVLLDADTEGVLLFSFNHLIVDAWALAILQRELVLTWHALGRGDVPAFEPLDLSASEHATAMHEELAPIFKRGREAYPPWPPDAYRLPLDHPAPVAPRREGTIVTRRIDAALVTRIRAATADAGVPLTAALVAAFQYALHRHARRPDVAFTVVRSGRRSRALREVVAYLSYGDTVEGRLVPGETWAALLERAGRIVLDESSERVPYNLIVQPPSMRVVLNVHNFTSNAAETAPFHYEHENRHPYLWPVWDLFFQILPVDGALLVEVLYRDQVLRSETVAQLWGSFERALTALTETPSAEISAEVD